LSTPILFENARYTVGILAYPFISLDEHITVNGAQYASYYAVLNKSTNVIELKTPGLVEAIFFAENSDRMLENQPWMWARQAESIAEAAPSGLSN
jgi:hypothetical protein